MCKFLNYGFASLMLVAMCALSAMAQTTNGRNKRHHHQPQ